VLLGGTVSFTATVTNSNDTVVNWSVNGIPGGSAQVGTISADGVYTAPADLPQGGTVEVTATSHADISKSSTAAVTISSDIAIAISPATSSVELGSTQAFHASISSNGHPDTTTHWSLSGSSCPSSCGSIDANGNYTAPQILPSAANVTITAISAADPSKTTSAAATVTSNFTLQVSAPTSLATGATSAIVAIMTPVPGSHPDGALAWNLSGTGCNGDACGILAVTTTQPAGAGSFADTASYTAPQTSPQPNKVTITVTPAADGTKKAVTNITIQSSSGGSIRLSPITATLAANHRTTLTVSESGVTAR
jgi:hypothetical protein